MSKLSIINTCCGTKLRTDGCRGPLVLSKSDSESCCCSCDNHSGCYLQIITRGYTEEGGEGEAYNVVLSVYDNANNNFVELANVTDDGGQPGTQISRHDVSRYGFKINGSACLVRIKFERAPNYSGDGDANPYLADSNGNNLAEMTAGIIDLPMMSFCSN